MLEPPFTRTPTDRDVPGQSDRARHPAARIKTLLKHALLVLSLAWLVGVVLHLLLNGSWWGAFPTDLIPPIGFVVVPVLVTVLVPSLTGQPRWITAGAAALSLALALGFGLSGLNAHAFAARPPVAAGSLRVFAWNTEYWYQGQSADAFYRYLRAQHADVYLLQEYIYFDDNTPQRIDKTAELRREFPGYHIVVRGELVTLSRLPVVSAEALKAGPLPPDGSGWHAYWADKVLRTDVQVQGRIVSFYDVHLPTPIGSSRNPLSSTFFHQAREGFAMREPQIAALNADVDRNPNPVLVAGDWNTTPAMREHNKVTSALTDAIGANRSLVPLSWPDRGPLPPLTRLDWTFTNKGLRVSRYSFEGAQGLSDHRAQSIVAAVR
ncbi:endonuclease/exonuclease/phosphatase family protein [Streptomyces sp. NPDC001177]